MSEHACQIRGCPRARSWRVSGLTRIREVCSSCRDELISVFGWKLLGPVEAQQKITV